MAKDDEQKPKSGFTVGEIEGKMRKYGLEIILTVVFILTAIFALIHGGGMLHWSILLCMIFAIIGLLVPKAMNKVTTHALKFVTKEKITGIITAIVAILIAIFLPAIIFAIVGIVAGKTFSFDAHEHIYSKKPPTSGDNE